MKKVVLLVLTLIIIYIIFLVPRGLFFTLYDRNNQQTLLDVPVEVGDVLRLEIEHSFEHIPWFEYYWIQEDQTFLLDTIAVAGYGAGVPAEMDVPTRIEDGLVWMEDIGSHFEELKWITHSTFMKELLLNNSLIFDFRDLPNASFVGAKLYLKRGFI